ncbi:hypothetical protein PM3016_1438 [Paenibacillus mucilaginosus 3016]|uniref:HTH cro/C1-type domain-containing protein n=1 Tax=Paenibacillus mucilaginosus 3016 TaxID=1116391 RepID=H6NEQ9_9BACL|nr:helix-turn-helix transcriptional regulator [Paenibacillus mucilaginosus]AFC28363.1 hypothetical protein PM3016_1438 [Paenibacillus mucilaginosus 3016]WFA17164.1 XRE family transcriptional regulator [Paenibacillus mucilaginosus]
MIITSKEVSAELRKKRRAAGYSQEDMAGYLGVTQATISKYERGRIPDAATYKMWLWFCENPPIARFEINLDGRNNQHA